MKKIRLMLALARSLVAPAHAALDVGARAPDFTLQASLAGEAFTFSLAEALGSGPVVLYFYPAAFTPGCTIEAHRFAEAIDEFAELGATVIGVSGDDVDTLKRFSVSECRGRFAVAADADGSVMEAYRATLARRAPFASRTSYVIAPDGTIVMVYTALKPDEHVHRALEAVRRWRAQVQG